MYKYVPEFLCIEREYELNDGKLGLSWVHVKAYYNIDNNEIEERLDVTDAALDYLPLHNGIDTVVWQVPSLSENPPSDEDLIEKLNQRLHMHASR